MQEIIKGEATVEARLTRKERRILAGKRSESSRSKPLAESMIHRTKKQKKLKKEREALINKRSSEFRESVIRGRKEAFDKKNKKNESN